jgi:flagellin
VTVSFSVGNADANGYAAAISAFNAQSAKTGVTASYDSTNGGLKLTNASGNDIKLSNKSTDAAALAKLGTYDSAGSPLATPVATEGANGATAVGRITMDSDKSFSIKDASGFGLAGGTAAGSSSLKSVANLDISTFDGAQLAIKIADAALSAVNGKRAEYGALQSRFSSAISNLASSTENLSASKSRITDTDFASETANMTRGQILQQAGTSMLAQANSLPNGVLSLLRG